MDERLLDFLDMMLAERFQLSYASMRQETQSEQLVAQVIEASSAIQSSPTLRQEDKELIEEYFSLTTTLDNRFQQYLYIQGAKDCVAILRELGVIK